MHRLLYGCTTREHEMQTLQMYQLSLKKMWCREQISNPNARTPASDLLPFPTFHYISNQRNPKYSIYEVQKKSRTSDVDNTWMVDAAYYLVSFLPVWWHQYRRQRRCQRRQRKDVPQLATQYTLKRLAPHREKPPITALPVPALCSHLGTSTITMILPSRGTTQYTIHSSTHLKRIHPQKLLSKPRRYPGTYRNPQSRFFTRSRGFM